MAIFIWLMPLFGSFHLEKTPLELLCQEHTHLVAPLLHLLDQKMMNM